MKLYELEKELSFIRDEGANDLTEVCLAFDYDSLYALTSLSIIDNSIVIDCDDSNVEFIETSLKDLQDKLENIRNLGADNLYDVNLRVNKGQLYCINFIYIVYPVSPFLPYIVIEN